SEPEHVPRRIVQRQLWSGGRLDQERDVLLQPRVPAKRHALLRRDGTDERARAVLLDEPPRFWDHVLAAGDAADEQLDSTTGDVGGRDPRRRLPAARLRPQLDQRHLRVREVEFVRAAERAKAVGEDPDPEWARARAA